VWGAYLANSAQTSIARTMRFPIIATTRKWRPFLESVKSTCEQTTRSVRPSTVFYPGSAGGIFVAADGRRSAGKTAALFPWSRTKMEPITESIRDLVRRALEDLGISNAQPTGESLLTLAGYYVGREFRFAGVRAVWVAGQGQIKFYDDERGLLRSVSIEQVPAKAA
jgi:hypothetical protein